MPSPDERARFLAGACKDEPEVRAQVESLLQAGEPSPDFLKQPPPDTGPAVDLVTEKPGDVFGPYKLLQPIGEGGFGVVWMAEQSHPILRKVALKVVKAGMDTKQVLARFEAERQALAMMDHPNIARVLDAGATPAGRPYFAMELVKGIPITEFCDQKRLDTRQRLELFCDVCSAVNHAHQKGVIHRDLKPSNVMVTLDGDRGVVKVIDFGIAKATEQKLTDKTLLTRFEQFLGTPVYMSPEQAAMSAKDIDTRSDIYSLGMLLYELLAGRPAFDPKTLLSAGYDEMRRIIKEDEPPRPSVCLSETRPRAAPDASENSGLPIPHSALRIPHSAIDPDLDWIVMKCLEKDRNRRYETANGLAADIQRHLTNEPVTARPASKAYRLQKAFRRNKLAFTATAAVALSLIAGTIVSTWQAIEASRARHAEKQERRRAEAESLNARQIAYASDTNLAHQAVKEDDFYRALQLLDRHRPDGKVTGDKWRVTNKETRTSPVSDSLVTDLRGWEWRYLWRQCQGEERFILGEHAGGATAVGMLKDGKTVFSGGRDKCVRLWDLESRRLIGLLQHEEAVIGAAASPDGRWLATASSTFYNENRLVIWDLATNKPATLSTEFYLRPGGITFSPDSKWLAFAVVFGGVRIWEVDTRNDYEVLPSIRPTPGGFAFSTDSRTLAYNENDHGAILLWDLASRSVVGRLPGHQSAVTALAFSPDRQTLASGSDDRTARLWNVGGRQEKFQISNHSGEFGSLAFSPEGGTLAISIGDGGGRIIRLVDVETTAQIAELRGHLKGIAGLAFTADGKALLSASDDGTVRVWDARPRPKETSARPIAPDLSAGWSTYGPALSLSPDGRHLITVYSDRRFSIWDTLGLAEGERQPLPFGDTSIAAVAAGGRLAAFASDLGEVKLWDAETGQARFFARPVTGRIHRLAFSLDGRFLAVANDTRPFSPDGHYTPDTLNPRSVRVWDVGTGKETHNFSTDDEMPASLTFSADGGILMAGTARGPLKLWQLDKPGGASTFFGHSGWVRGLALLPDRQTLISAGTDIRFWDVRTRLETAPRLSPRAGDYYRLALSPDGRRFAAAGSDGRITIWDVAAHQEVATLVGHNKAVRQLAFTPDGDHLVSVSMDQVRVWRAASPAVADAAPAFKKLNSH